MILLGIDPSLTATGLTLLDVSGAPKVLGHMVVRSGTSRPFEERLQRITANVRRLAGGNVTPLEPNGLPHAQRVIIEDPTTFKNRWPSNLRSSVSIARLGAAFGAAIAGCPSDVHVVSQDWIPRSIAHKQFRAQLKARYPVLAPLPDDAVFAAGVALYWLDHQSPARQRLAALRG